MMAQCTHPHVPARPAPTAAPDATARAEQGQSLVEIIVVLVIVAIITAATVNALHSSKTTGRQTSATAAAQAYATAIRQYTDEHGNIAPAIGSQRWTDTDKGPVDPLTRPPSGLYMRGGTPEPVQKGWTTLVKGPASAPADRMVYRISASDPSRFEIAVYVENKYRCSVGDDIQVTPGFVHCT